MGEKYEEICKKWTGTTDSSKNTPQSVKDEINEVVFCITTLLMIYRTSETLWSGQPCVKLPPIHREEIECAIHPKYLDAIYQVERGLFRMIMKSTHGGTRTVSADMFRNMMMQTRACYTFPYLAVMLQKGIIGRQDMTVQGLTQHGWISKPENSPYFKHLAQLVPNNNKIDRWYQ
jgi:hypothetical protein